MRFRDKLFPVGLLAFFLLQLSPIHAQNLAQGCQLVQSSAKASHSDNLFTDEMENELGEIADHELQLRYRTIDDPMLTAYIQNIGERLVAAMPPTKLRFHFDLIDLAEANAFGMPGGRIYVSRKLVALFKSEDEMAAVLAHEIGHIVAHQSAEEISRQMRAVLRIDHLEQGEVFDRYNELIENWNRKGVKHAKEIDAEDAQQGEADRVGIYGLANAGYSPSVMADFFDRFAGTQGKTGNWFTDMFGGTSRDSRRLREMIRKTSAYSAGCNSHPQKASVQEFRAWQAAVANYTGSGHQEALSGVTQRKTLHPALRADLEQIRISPDGKYFLAQDENTITVFSRETYQPIFVINSEQARPARFSQDSKQISFYTTGVGGAPRVEVWKIEDGSHEVFEVFDRRGCLQTALSPDGKTFACISVSEAQLGDGGLSVNAGLIFELHLRRVEDGEIIYENNHIFAGQLFQSIRTVTRALEEQQEVHVMQMEFSPNGQVLLLGRKGVGMGVDVRTGKSLSLDGNIKRILQIQFAFLDDSRVFGAESTETSMVVSYPDGKILADNLPTGVSYITPAAKGEYVVFHPIKDYAAGVFSLKDRRFVFALKNPAIDVYEDQSIRENSDGQLTVNSMSDGKRLRALPMPETVLSHLKASALSSDMKYLALSGSGRGGIWDLEKNERPVYVRGFNSAAFLGDGKISLEFPGNGDQKRAVALATLSAPPTIDKVRDLDDDLNVMHFGELVIVFRPEKKNELRQHITVEVREQASDKVLWSRQFAKQVPSFYLDSIAGTMVLRWNYEEDEARSAVQRFPELLQGLKSSSAKRNACYLELLDPLTGRILHRALIDTGSGSFNPRDAFHSATRLFVSDNEDRTLVYTLDGKKLIGRVLGRSASVTPDGKWLLVRDGHTRIAIYDAETLTLRDRLTFSSAVTSLFFGEHGTAMLVLTADQTIIRFDVRRIGENQGQILQ